jgi:hypothetical protein
LIFCPREGRLENKVCERWELNLITTISQTELIMDIEDLDTRKSNVHQSRRKYFQLFVIPTLQGEALKNLSSTDIGLIFQLINFISRVLPLLVTLITLNPTLTIKKKNLLLYYDDFN